MGLDTLRLFMLYCLSFFTKHFNNGGRVMEARPADSTPYGKQILESLTAIELFITENRLVPEHVRESFAQLMEEEAGKLAEAESLTCKLCKANCL